MERSEEDVCDTGLALGLGYKGSCHLPSDHHRQSDFLMAGTTPLEPSLTLGLFGDEKGLLPSKAAASKASPEVGFARQLSMRSSVSSGIKRKKDMCGEEAEDGKLSPRLSDEEEVGGARKKLRLTKEQSQLLEDKFKEHSTLNPRQKQALAKQLNLRPRQVEVWFQNRRARTKLKQTEVDCELLKKCCEKLADENQRLRRELQELKTLKTAAPTFTQLPTASLTICPSCERVTGGDVAKAGSLMSAAAKKLFLKPFTPRKPTPSF